VKPGEWNGDSILEPMKGWIAPLREIDSKDIDPDAAALGSLDQDSVGEPKQCRRLRPINTGLGPCPRMRSRLHLHDDQVVRWRVLEYKVCFITPPADIGGKEHEPPCDQPVRSSDFAARTKHLVSSRSHGPHSTTIKGRDGEKCPKFPATRALPACSIKRGVRLSWRMASVRRVRSQPSGACARSWLDQCPPQSTALCVRLGRSSHPAGQAA